MTASARPDLRREPLVTSHALDRYREHWPDATPSELLEARLRGLPIPAETARSIAGSIDGRPRAYVLSWDRRGIFVDAPPTKPPWWRRVIVTYLRLGMIQELFAGRLYPIDRGPP